MNNNPLQRRMFAQQMMNQHNRANQPMGILASSPQLMNAAQGFKDGGMVKGYEGGGLEVGQSTPLNQIYGSNIPAPDFSGPLYKGIGGGKRKEQEIARIKQTELEKLKQSGFGDVGPTISVEDAKNSPRFFEQVEPAIVSQEKKTNEENVIVDDMRDSGINKDNQGTDKYAGTDDVGVANLINQKLVNGLATETKETDVLVPKTSDIQKKATASLEAWKKKLIKTDKTYEVSEKKSQTMLAEVQKVLEETDEEIDLAGIERMAKKTLGLKEGKEYDEDRLTSFWMAMIKGGLATAAGESSNALTNIAKGLGFGVEAYGKDLNAINEDEREDRKALAKMKFDLIRDEKTARIAKRTLKLQGYSTLATMEQKQNMFESKEAYQKERDMIKDQMAFANLDLVATQTFNKIGMDGATHDLRIAAFGLDKQKQKDFVKANNDKLNQDYKLDIMTKEMKNVYSLGDNYVKFDEKTKTFSYTPLGESALIASIASKTTLTDLKTTAKQNAKSKEVFGNKYATEKEAESAYYKYEGQFKDRLTAIYKMKDPLGKVDTVGQEAALAKLQKEFGTASNSLTSIGTSSTTTPKIGDTVTQGPNKFKFLGDGKYEKVIQ